MIPELIPLILLSEGYCPACRGRMAPVDREGWCQACQAFWSYQKGFGGVLLVRLREDPKRPDWRATIAAESVQLMERMPTSLCRDVPRVLLEEARRTNTR